MAKNTISNVSTFGDGLASRFADILNRDTKAVTTVNNDTEITTLTLNLKHKLANGADVITISNPDTIKAVERIQKADDIEALTPTIKCVELAKMANDVTSEFSMSIESFAYSVFNISKTTAQQYVRIGRYFYDENGNMKSKLIPFLNTSQIIPLLARLEFDENGELKGNGLGFIEEAFTPNEKGESLLHGSDSASYIKKALKRYDAGELDINGNDALTIAEKEARLAQERANRKAKKEAEKNNSENSADNNNEEITPIQSFSMNLSKLFATIESLTSSFEAVKEAKSITEERANHLLPVLEKLTEIESEIMEIMNK